MDAVLSAYIECALWSSTGDDGEPLDDVYGPDDLAPETVDSMRADLADFVDLVTRERLDVTAIDPGQFGHDFWLTRNGHGAGFWDRGLGALGDRLTELAKPYGESYLYVGDDGLIYVN
jgi:hypothetical protein